MDTDTFRDAGSRDIAIAGIGASAGGIAALQALFKSLSATPDLAIVVVLHLPPGEPSRLMQLIANWSSLPVHAAADGVRPQAQCIYVPSPDHILTLEDGVFRTRAAPGGNLRPGISTIDAFFESLADDRGPRALAVILSGTGMDGTAGATRIYQAGGTVLVQDPLTALHDGMPRAVIARGIANQIITLDAIGPALATCVSPGYVRSDVTNVPATDLTRQLDRILELIRKRAGFDLSGYKPSPLLWRIQHRMDVRGAVKLDDYLALLEDDAVEVEALTRGIPIHVTEFFRDPMAWDILSQDVLTPLFAEERDGPLRAWTPACSTGEEAYSLAMLLTECAERKNKPADFQLFATDASPEILVRASRGVFSEKSLKGVTAERRACFFYGVDGEYRVHRPLREKMVFAAQDLLSDPPFTGLDLVTCRNLLIYLEPEATRHVVFLLHSALRMGGYLFLGKGEMLSTRQSGFQRVSAQWNIYRKTGAIPDVRIKFPSRPQRDPAAAPSLAHRVAVDHFDLPSVMIDDRFNILRVYGNTDAVLRLPAGEPTHNLLKVAQPELVSDIQLGVKRALSGMRSITLDTRQNSEKLNADWSLRITPLNTSADEESPRLLISFIERQRRVSSDGTIDTAGISRTRAAADKRDLAEAMRVSQEELDASREELQALNEELRASNEQLNTSNEDLNEANERLQEKIDELEMQSRVLSSGEVMTLFLDDELKVQWFTPAASAIFPLRAGDAGRCIADFVPNVEDESFVGDVTRVMHSRELREAEVRHKDGRWFVRAIRPNLSGKKGTSGVAVTYSDISERKRREEELRQSNRLVESARDYAEATLNTSPVPLLVLEPDLTVVTANEAFYSKFNVRRAETEKRKVFDLGSGQWNIPRLRELLQDILPSKIWFDNFEVSHEFAGIGERVMLLNARRMKVIEGGAERIILVIDDITDRKRAEVSLRASEERQAFLLKLSDALRPLRDSRDVKRTAARVLGEHLGVNRAFYTLVENDQCVVVRGYDAGVPPLPDGPYAVDTYGRWIMETYRAGGRLVACDTQDDPRFSTRERTAHAAAAIIGAIGVPLVKDGRLIAIFMLHTAARRDWRNDEIELIEQTAERTWAAVERARAETALAEELRSTEILQNLSARFVTEENIQKIYEEILSAAIDITRAKAGTVQILDVEAQELVILATRGFSRKTQDYFHRVDAGSNTSCGLALRTGARSYFDFDPASPDVSIRLHVEDGVYSAQSSPLISRSGKPLGMVSTHWAEPGHRPSERDLRFLDLLARQAADLIEHRQAEAALAAELAAMKRV